MDHLMISEIWALSEGFTHSLSLVSFSFRMTSLWNLKLRLLSRHTHYINIASSIRVWVFSWRLNGNTWQKPHHNEYICKVSCVWITWCLFRPECYLMHLPHLLHFLSLDYEFPDDMTNETCIEALVTYITFTSFLSCTGYLMVPFRSTAL